MNALADILDTTGLFYYMTMKDYERKDTKSKKFSPHIVKRVSPNQKMRLIENKELNFSSMFDFKLLKKQITDPIRVESYEDLFSFLSQLPIEQCLIPSTPLNSYFPCRFIPGNYAWVSQNKNGHSRYFSKRKGSDSVSFDLIDLVEIAYRITTMEAIEKIIELLSIRFMEDVWRKDQKEKYIRNYQFITQEIQKESHYPALHSYLREFTPLLEAMNALGTIYIHKKEYSLKEHNLFFASCSHISNFLGAYTPSKVVKILNLFATLGLIEKAHPSELHPLFLKESAKITEMRGLGNMISYYIVHPFEDVAAIAEERAVQLSKNGIRYSNLSKTVLGKVLGIDFANTVYVQTVQKNKKRQEKRLEVVQHQLELNFLSLSREHDYVTKSKVLEIPVVDLSDSQRKHHLNQIWMYLIEKYNCEYIKPTKELKASWQLTSSEYVSIPRDRNSL